MKNSTNFSPDILSSTIPSTQANSTSVMNKTHDAQILGGFRPKRIPTGISVVARGLFVALLAGSMLTSQAKAQSCGTGVLIESKSSSAGRGKVGFGECLPSTPPKLFLTATTVDTASYSSHWAYDAFGPTSPHIEDNSGSFTETTVVTLDKIQAHPSTSGCQWTAPETTTCSGSSVYSWALDDVDWFESYPDDVHSTNYNGTITNCEPVQWSDGGWSKSLVNNLGDDVGDALYYYLSPPTSTTLCTSTLNRSSWTGSTSGSDVNEFGDTTEYSYTLDTVNTTTLTSEYTDAMLREDILGDMPAYPSEWAGGPGEAFFTLDSSHICGSAGKMKYHFKIPNSEKDVTYKIEWDEITTYPDGTSSANHMEEEVEGTGDPVTPVYSSDHEVLPPATPGTITVENESVTIVPGPPGPPGSGNTGGGDQSGGRNGSGGDTGAAGFGASGGSGGCGTCSGGSSSSSSIGSGGAAAGPSFTLSMGAAGLGGSAGRITFKSPKPASGAYTPDLLRFTGSARPDVDVVRVGGVIRQIKAPQALADVVTIDANSYEVRYYYPSQVGAKGAVLYPINAGQNPFVTWKIENPNPGTSDQYRLSEVRGGTATRRWDYNYVTGTDSWKAQPYGTTIEEEVSIPINGSSLRQQINVVRDSASPTVNVLRTKRTYQKFNWGEGLVESVLGEDSNPKTTTYTYYASPPFTPNGTRIPLQQVIHPDGSWEYYASYDSAGRPLTVYSSFGNVSAASYSSGRLTTSAYGQLAGAPDNGTISPDSPRTVTESLPGGTVSRRYTIFPSAYERLEIQCGSSLGTWNAADNLITTNRYYSSGVNQFRLKSVVRPDRTMQTYDYNESGDGNYRTNITASGQPDATFAYIVGGTSNRVVISKSGYTVSAMSWDIQSGIKLSEAIYSQFDSIDRPQHVTYLDGTSEHFNYDCCGIDSQIDRDGVQTFYGYDAAKRPTSAWRLGITNLSVLDAAGRVVQRIRKGTDGSQIVQAQYRYDSAGELLYETNALNGVTTYTNIIDGSGQTIKTNTYPDGGTRIEIYYRDGSLKQVTGTAVQPVRYEYGVETTGTDAGRPYTKEIKLQADGVTDSTEWTKSYTDTFGRTYKTLYAAASGTPAGVSYFNNKGQLWKQVDPDGVVTLYLYNAKGEREYTIQAVKASTRDLASYESLESSFATIKAGTDRISRVVVDAQSSALYAYDTRRTRTYAWGTDAADSFVQLTTTETSTDGRRSWQTVYRDAAMQATTSSETLYNNNDGTVATGYRTTTMTQPDGSKSVSVYYQGRRLSATRKDSVGAQVTRTAYAYDAHGRQSTTTDARNGATTYAYNNADQVTSVTTPSPASGQTAQTTVTYYNKSLQATNVIAPDGGSVTNEYLLTGLLKKTYGSRTYPVEYTYDYAGRMKTMKTWQDFTGNAGTAITTWNYDAYRGWLANKRYADSTGPDYTYTVGGRLKTRTWARTGTSGRIVTTYKYGFDDSVSDNQHGDLVEISYTYDPQSTPTVGYTYDRRGRQKQISMNGTLTQSLTYNDANEQLTESYVAGTLNGVTVTSGYDNFLRRNSLSAQFSSTPLLQHSYTYDNASRLQTVTDNSGATPHSATYGYLANSPLVSTVTFKQNTTTRMTTTKNYDFLNRLSSVSSAPSASSAVSFGYSYNSANQRIRRIESDSSYWLYEYDALGQVKRGAKYFSDGNPVPGQQFEYGHDDIGNRKSTKAGGDENGLNLRPANYTPNNLNQYTGRTVPGAFDVIGLAMGNNATLTVNSTAPWRKGEYFRKELSVVNTSVPVWQSVTVAATGEPTVTGNVFVPQTPEVFAYDLDGNLTQDGRWTYTWDAENRLVQVESRSDAPSLSRRKVVWEYDAKGRRIRQTTYNGSSGTFVVTEDLKLVSDGWRHIAELNAANNALVRSYVWGMDMSGSMDGAGGVGGLLAINSVANGAHFYAYDGNGNVAALVKASDGTASANYEYEPFGKIIRSTGIMADENAFGFSTKRSHRPTRLVLYEFRPYDADQGRWLSRDPIGERGGKNLYGFVGNAPSQSYDVLGLQIRGPGGGTIPEDPKEPGNDEPDVSWAPPACGKGLKTIYIQVLYGGWGRYSGPRTDDGSAGYGVSGGSKGCPDYKLPASMSGVFQDSPKGATGPVQFIVCRVCMEQCCDGKWKIASIGPCVYWKKGDKGSPYDPGSGMTTVEGPPQTWQVGLDKNYPDIAKGGCYKCKD